VTLKVLPPVDNALGGSSVFSQVSLLANDVVAYASGTSPYVFAYPWTSGTGYGTKYADPSTLAGGGGHAIDFNVPTATVLLASAAGTTPTGTVGYPWSAGFGSKFAQPSTAFNTTTHYDASFHPTGNAVSMAGTLTPFIEAYAWSSAGWGSKFTSPAALAGTTYATQWNPAGTYLAVQSGASPNIYAFPWSGSGFGTKVADPSTLVAAANRGDIAWSPNGDLIALSSQNIPSTCVYAWSGSGFGTKYTDPAVYNTQSANYPGAAFSPQQDAIAFCGNSTVSPYLFAYAWSSSGFGTKYADAAAPLTTDAYRCEFNDSGTDFTAGANGTPYWKTWAWTSASGFGTAYTNPAGGGSSWRQKFKKLYS
jgi:hypothetical protein